MTSRNRLLVSLAVLGTVFWVGVAGYLFLDDDLTLLDAIYMVAITLSTVGYREVTDRTPAIEIWTVLIITVGVVATMIALGSVTGMIVGGEVGRMIGGRRLESRIKLMKGHTIVCGLGRMGMLLVKQLREARVPVVVIERDLQVCRQAEELELTYVVGDATDEDALERAGIARAKSLVTVLRSDADNVFATLTARGMRPDMFIVARAEQFSAEPKLRRAGANRVISPQAIGAERIANVLTRPHLVDFVEVAAKGLDFEMDAVDISASSPVAGQTLRQANLRATANVMVVAIRKPDGETRFNPPADEVLSPKDTLITIGPAGAAARLADMRMIAEPATASEDPPAS